jgi:Tol biopolymer transport system component
MPDPLIPDASSLGQRPPGDRLDSWKEIAAYMKRDVTTVQRWEKREGMPVYRHVHDKMGSVYAFRSDLDAWARTRDPDAVPGSPAEAPPATRRLLPNVRVLVAAGSVVALAIVLGLFRFSGRAGVNPLADARFVWLTDSDGAEQSAAISPDGRFVAFLSNRDGRDSVWVTLVGSGQLHNLTPNFERELDNPSVRTLSFSPDGTHVTFWARRPGSTPTDIGVWSVPILGGEPRLYLEGVAEFDWSADETRLVYHTPGPGDPMFVRESGPQGRERLIFSAPEGLHGHFVLWSPNQAFVYFVQGAVPDRMDIWRIRPTGGSPERLTHHNAHVSHPVFIDDETLMYLASSPDGSGRRIHSLDVRRRVTRPVSFGADRYTSLAASADGRRLVVTLANPKGTLWRVPLTGSRADMAAAHRIPLLTGNGSSPRLGDGYLLYVSSKGDSDSIWKLRGDVPTELWSAPGARIIDAPAIARDGSRMAFTATQNGQTILHVAKTDGSGARVVTSSLELQGAPAWSPDGQSVTVAALLDGVPRLHTVPLDGRPAFPLVDDYSLEPVWSASGDFVVFSGADVGTTFPVRAVTAGGRPYPLRDLTLTRGARRLAFMPGHATLVVLRGDLRHKNLWTIDLETGAERQVTDFASDFDVRDFDISADGREIILEQVQEHSDVVLLELPKR